MSEATPTIDFTQIQFPSDRITISELRKLWPWAFDEYRPPKERQLGLSERRGNLEHTLGGVIDCERFYADLVFRKALGLPRANGGKPIAEGEAGELAEDYEGLGWARGVHEGQEMVRRIETQALAQAEQYLGRNR